MAKSMHDVSDPRNQSILINVNGELKPRAEVILNLDHAQRGLGTASCGPDTLEQYCLLKSSYQFAYRLQPLHP